MMYMTTITKTSHKNVARENSFNDTDAATPTVEEIRAAVRDTLTRLEKLAVDVGTTKMVVQIATPIFQPNGDVWVRNANTNDFLTEKFRHPSTIGNHTAAEIMGNEPGLLNDQPGVEARARALFITFEADGALLIAVIGLCRCGVDTARMIYEMATGN